MVRCLGEGAGVRPMLAMVSTKDVAVAVDAMCWVCPG